MTTCLAPVHTHTNASFSVCSCIHYVGPSAHIVMCLLKDNKVTSLSKLVYTYLVSDFMLHRYTFVRYKNDTWEVQRPSKKLNSQKAHKRKTLNVCIRARSVNIIHHPLGQYPRSLSSSSSFSSLSSSSSSTIPSSS